MRVGTHTLKKSYTKNLAWPLKIIACTQVSKATNYYTVGFVCEVLICANHASCRGLTNFNSAVTLVLSFRLTVSVTVPCL